MIWYIYKTRYKRMNNWKCEFTRRSTFLFIHSLYHTYYQPWVYSFDVKFFMLISNFVVVSEDWILYDAVDGQLFDAVDGQLFDLIIMLGYTNCNTSNLLARIRESPEWVMDPVTEFGILFSALIRNVEHFGLSNQQHMDEGNPIAICYDGKNFTKNIAIEILWKLFIQSKYDDQWHCIFVSEEDMEKCRLLIVDCVLTTDILDKNWKCYLGEPWS
jgi:3'5'-cyclic nucleotide phosphodiesterase